MPKIPLSEAFGLDVDGKLEDTAKLLAILPQFLKLKDLALDEVPLDEASAALTFNQPIDLFAGNIALKVGASGGGRLTLIRPKQRALDEDDPFNEIPVNDDEIYVGIGLDFSLQADAAVTAGPAAFGFGAEHAFSVKCYRRFQKATGGFPPFSKAVGTTFSSFVLPRNAIDLDRLAPDTVWVLAGSGALSVSGGFSFSTPVESLASVSLVGDYKLEVNATGSVDVDAKVTLAGGYQVRVRHLGGRKIELGVYNLKSREFALSVSAQAGVAAEAAGFDLADKFIGALSRQPAVDISEFRQALPGEDDRAKDRRIAGFQDAVQAAISTKLQAAVSAAFSTLRSDEAAWLFEIDLDTAVSDAARDAIASALRGDFTGLTADPRVLPPGIVQAKNVLTRTDLSKQTLRVNLLGIVNFLSVGKLAQVSSVERNPSGEITLLTDTANASRLQALLVNLGGDTKRLRKMLSENFLIEAAYHVANLGVLPPEFKSRHTFLEIHGETGRDHMKDNLDVARVLGLIKPDQEQRRLGDRKQYGRTTFYAECRYASGSVRRIFLDDSGNPRSTEEYETLGRSALGALLAGDPGQELRQRYADLSIAGTDLWNAMKRTGNRAQFGPLFGLPAGSIDPRVEAAGADFMAITDWAAAMNAAGAAIHEVEQVLAGGAVDPEDPRLTAARKRLKGRLADAVQSTHEHFGDPLGMIMVYLASGENAEKSVIVTGDQIERLEVSSVPAQVGSRDA